MGSKLLVGWLGRCGLGLGLDSVRQPYGELETDRGERVTWSDSL